MSIKKLFILSALLWAVLPGAGAQTDSTFYIAGPMGRLASRLQLPATEPGKRCHIVVLCHGFTGNMGGPLFDGIAHDLLAEGIGVLRFDFNAHGQSDGEFRNMTVPNEIEDALAVVDWARRQPQTRDVSLLGHSQGGVVAAMTAGKLGRKTVKAVVLMAPAAVLRDDALRGNTMGAFYDPWNAPEYVQLPSGHQLGRDYIRTALTLPIYETAARYEGPVFIIHGQADRIVPYTYGERFHDVMPRSAIEVIPGEDHGFSADTPRAASLAVSWLAKTLR